METNGTNNFSSPPRLVTHATEVYPPGEHSAQPAPVPAPSWFDLGAVRREVETLVHAVAYGQLDGDAVPGAIGRLSSLLGVEFPEVPDDYFEGGAR